ncbi:glycosyltransferase family 2 protein [Flavobacterium sp.]|jgi:teichuronic acid biosynthesis glycosyltransferase TuaG|uniref:glycosyltransferase family 2 protein n=1 Tax=Flavobacterium sp. TaxID=239 RepID=UPI0037C0E18B
MAKLVSIITPTFNSASYIAETIQSVQNQTYQNWEMIIVDDGSTDETVSIIQQIQKTEHRINLVIQPKNVGPAITRNIGIELVQGKYLTFLDADDLWFPDFIQNSITTIQQTKVPFVFSSYRRADESLNFVYSDFIVPQKVTYTDILKTNSISCLTAFLDINVLGKKYMPIIQKRQDMGLWLQYLKKIPFAHGIQEPKAIYRIRKNSLSRKKSDLIKYQWQFYREVENLTVTQSAYYMVHWMIRGFLKYRN